MQNVYTVTQVNSYIKNMFTQDFMLNSISVKGEVSNCKYHSSGHIYFTLKDSKGAIACVMFAGNRSGLAFRMIDGQQVVVTGSVDVYERDGKYQLYAREIKQDGAGALYERFERLKAELEERGMFAKEYKQPIPQYINRLGIVTAETGAAIRDIIQIATRRNPYVQLILYPAIVQGDMAVQSIVNGIRAMERFNVDTIIVGRGGGSIEDLWAFNEEAVAQTIFDCPIPIISAVGHETDTTIADFVADLRAPTPSAAAELAVYPIEQLNDKIKEYAYTMQHMFKNLIGQNRSRLENYRMRIKYLSPVNQIREKRTYALKLEEALQDAIMRKISDRRHRLALYVEQMKGLSPLEKLSQGYSYVSDIQGRTVYSIEQIKPEDELNVYVKDGIINAKVMSRQKISLEESYE
ncbi:MAG: exodeoxyribonuclease VII large subunit [Lachnospiraceae bacterium]|nr:exodeoxyribonuclease VII large subunit [Lachnospiraceae bacterium]